MTSTGPMDSSKPNKKNKFLFYSMSKNISKANQFTSKQKQKVCRSKTIHLIIPQWIIPQNFLPNNLQVSDFNLSHAIMDLKHFLPNNEQVNEPNNVTI